MEKVPCHGAFSIHKVEAVAELPSIRLRGDTAMAFGWEFCN